MANVVVIGETGQLASSLKDLRPDFKFINRKQLDLQKLEEIEKFFAQDRPQTILNVSAYTQVDKAETERDLCYAVNALAAEKLARCCDNYFYISTDYVYGGQSTKPYLETDRVSPVNYYGETKLQGELLAQKTNPNTFVIRTSWLYSTVGINFVKRIAELAQQRPQLTVVNDQLGSPTWAPDLAAVLIRMVENKPKPGIYNYSNEGFCSWYDFAVEIVKASKGSAKVLPIFSEQYPTAAKRPAYSVLDKSKIKSALDIHIPHWTESFEKCKAKLGWS